MENNRAAIAGDGPRCRQRGLKRLRLPVQTDKNASGQVANVFRRFVVDQHGVESLRFAVQTEMQFTVRLCESRRSHHEEQKHRKTFQSPHHYASSSRIGKINWKQSTTNIRMARGASFNGLEPTAEKSSRPRNKLPHDGIGYITPSPSMLSVDSVNTNKGIEIQNCASNTGRRFGMTCRKMIR